MTNRIPLGLRALAGSVTFLALAFLASGDCQAAATSFPTRPVTIVVPFAAGGSLDATARAIAEKLPQALGKPVFVVNRPGAGSGVGASFVANSKPDGYTLFIASGSSFGFLHLILPDFKYRLRSFVPLGGVAIYTSLFAVNSSVPVNNLAELVKYAQGKPGGLSFCTTGVGGLNHLQLVMFEGLVKKKTGLTFKVTHVPYNGVAPALLALRTGQVQACTLPYSSIVRNFEGKGIHVIAMQRPTRLSAMPEVATTGQEGYPEMDGNEELVTLSAPAGTPPKVVKKLESALRTVMKDPSVLKKLNDLDVEPTFVGAGAARKWLSADIAKYSALIRTAGLAKH